MQSLTAGSPSRWYHIDLHIVHKPHRENALIDVLYEVSQLGYQNARSLLLEAYSRVRFRYGAHPSRLLSSSRRTTGKYGAFFFFVVAVTSCLSADLQRCNFGRGRTSATPGDHYQSPRWCPHTQCGSSSNIDTTFDEEIYIVTLILPRYGRQSNQGDGKGSGRDHAQ
jgi:hypothetical protein